MDGYLRTVNGDVKLERNWHIQCHEHVYIADSGMGDIVPSFVLDDEEKSLDELVDYRVAGGGVIVDAQPGYCGRNVTKLQRLARESRVHIVGVTGFHLPVFYRNASFFAQPVEALEAYFTAELNGAMLHNDGTKSTGRAGVIKAASGGQPTDTLTANAWKAAALSATKTKAPVLIHLDKNSDPFEIVRFLTGQGIDVQRILLCHVDRTHHDVSIHKRLCQLGVTLCYDSVHRLKYVSDAAEIALIKTMCDEGLDTNIVLSLDTTKERLRHYGGLIGLDYLLVSFVDQLRAEHVSENAIKNMTKRNAARWLQVHEE